MLVSAHGALIMLATMVEMGQTLAVVNPENQQEREARVAYVGSPHAGMAEVGLEFVRPSPEFWPVITPPDDWS